ncbi:hypothetical protein VPH35_014145 [Triticum aestivum]|uniref:Uncharacterized protein n=1 Tax=Aegilops tauschii TaxID=37682 RepID=M8AKI1_AEGTA
MSAEQQQPDRRSSAQIRLGGRASHSPRENKIPHTDPVSAWRFRCTDGGDEAAGSGERAGEEGVPGGGADADGFQRWGMGSQAQIGLTNADRGGEHHASCQSQTPKVVARMYQALAGGEHPGNNVLGDLRVVSYWIDTLVLKN